MLKKGIRVRNLKMPDWGIGEVLEDATDTSVRVFFVEAGERKLHLASAALEEVAPGEAAHPGLDNLSQSVLGKKRGFKPLAAHIKAFLESYPDGFYGERFLREERDYKVQAHQLAQELLDEASLSELIRAEQWDEVAKRAMRIANATNLIFPNEKMALSDGLADAQHQRQFALTLHALLYAPGELQERFEGFCQALEAMGAAKWTIASYFPFVAFPDRYMFLKPTVTQQAADASVFEINYKPELNWLTFKSLHSFAEHLRSQLAELKPRDMIDVQSFMWCIAKG